MILDSIRGHSNNIDAVHDAIEDVKRDVNDGVMYIINQNEKHYSLTISEINKYSKIFDSLDKRKDYNNVLDEVNRKLSTLIGNSNFNNNINKDLLENINKIIKKNDDVIMNNISLLFAKEMDMYGKRINLHENILKDLIKEENELENKKRELNKMEEDLYNKERELNERERERERERDKEKYGDPNKKDDYHKRIPGDSEEIRKLWSELEQGRRELEREKNMFRDDTKKYENQMNDYKAKKQNFDEEKRKFDKEK
jgi:hypothetical protein